MTEERPEALLKSALEKIIYFEARSEALHNDLAATRAEAERLKGELAQAAERELALRQRLAEAEVQASRAHRDREAAARLNEALRQERASLIDKIVETARIHGTGSDASEDGLDLASFIAQLRSEALGAQEAPKAHADAGGSTGSPRTGLEHAERLRAEGRLEVRSEELVALSRQDGALAGRTEETLFGFSVRELSSPDAGARGRAAERLEALGASAAAPALATAIHQERDAAALPAMLSAFGALAGQEGIAVIAPQLSSGEPSVRIAALKAMLALDASAAAPYLSMAMKDPDAAVRRRASLLALGLSPDAALGLGQQAVRDADPEVRALGALALGAATGERARALLLGALRDSELKVRQAAARGLSRLVGEDLSPVASLPDAQRRREIRRVAALPARAVSLDALRQAPRERVTARTLVVDAPAPVSSKLPHAVLAELRRSLRGLTLPDLAAAVGEPSPHVNATCAELIHGGAVVRRGIKYFVA